MKNINKTSLALLISTLIGAQGCSTLSDEQAQHLQGKERALQAREAELNRREQLLGQTNRQPMQTPVQADGELLPPNANPGECYARLWVEPVYETVTRLR